MNFYWKSRLEYKEGHILMIPKTDCFSFSFMFCLYHPSHFLQLLAIQRHIFRAIPLLWHFLYRISSMQILYAWSLALSKAGTSYDESLRMQIVEKQGPFFWTFSFCPCCTWLWILVLSKKKRIIASLVFFPLGDFSPWLDFGF